MKLTFINRTAKFNIRNDFIVFGHLWLQPWLLHVSPPGGSVRPKSTKRWKRRSPPPRITSSRDYYTWQYRGVSNYLGWPQLPIRPQLPRKAPARYHEQYHITQSSALRTFLFLLGGYWDASCRLSVHAWLNQSIDIWWMFIINYPFSRFLNIPH